MDALRRSPRAALHHLELLGERRGDGMALPGAGMQLAVLSNKHPGTAGELRRMFDNDYPYTVGMVVRRTAKYLGIWMGPGAEAKICSYM